MQKSVKPLLAVILALLIIFFAYSPVIKTASNFMFGEAVFFWNYGNAMVKHNVLTFHQIGLWDDRTGLGYSLISHLSNQFYPLTWISFAFNNIMVAAKWQLIIHLLLAAAAFMFLMRVFKASWTACIFGSSIYLLNWYMYQTTINGYFSEIFNLVFTPLAVAFCWKALFEKKPLFAVLSGLSLALQILAMSLYTIFHTILAVLLLLVFYALYQLIYALKHRETRALIGEAVHTIKVTVIIFATGLGVSAVKLLPVLEYKKISMRNYAPLYAPGVDVPTISYFKTYFANYLINTADVTFWIQLATVCFFIFVLLSLTRIRKEVVYLLFVTLISFTGTLGYHAPVDLNRIFYMIGFTFSENIYRYLILANLSLAGLASLGLTNLQFYVSMFSKKFRLNRQSRSIAIAATLIIPIIIVWQAAGFIHKQFVMFSTSDVKEKSVYLGHKNNYNEILASKVASEKRPIRIASTYQSGGKSVFDYTAYLYGFDLSNNPHTEYAPTYQYFGYTPVIKDDDPKKTEKTQEFIRKKYKLFSLMNVGYSITHEANDDYPNAYVTPLLKDGLARLYKVNEQQPRVFNTKKSILIVGNNEYLDFDALQAKALFLLPEYDIKNVSFFTLNPTDAKNITNADLEKFNGIIRLKPYNSGTEINKRLDSFTKQGNHVISLALGKRHYEDIRIRSNSIVNDKPAVYLKPEDRKLLTDFINGIPEADKKIAVRSIINSPEKKQFRISTSSTNTPVIFSESYYPGWYLKIDGKRAPIYMADGLVKGFILGSAGTHDVLLEYKPQTFLYGALISIASLAMVLIYFIIHVFNVRTKRYEKKIY